MDVNKANKSKDQDATQRARREFLRKAGKLAVYTPPIMMGLLMPGKHAIASGFQRPKWPRKPKWSWRLRRWWRYFFGD